MSVLFAALLGFNPLAQLVPHPVLAALPAHVRATLLAPHFFPTLIAGAFMDSLRVVFLFAAAMSVVAAFASVLRGQQYIYDDEAEGAPSPAGPPAAQRTGGPATSSGSPPAPEKTGTDPSETEI